MREIILVFIRNLSQHPASHACYLFYYFRVQPDIEINQHAKRQSEEY